MLYDKKIEDDLYSLVNTMVLPFKMSVSFGSYFLTVPNHRNLIIIWDLQMKQCMLIKADYMKKSGIYENPKNYTCFFV